jgi:glutaredoxin
MKKATIYRMVKKGHTCPYGIKSLYLLKKHGYEVEDVHLKTKDETEAFKAKYNVKTTPQIFINGEHIGDDDDLKRLLGYKVPTEDDTSYTPVIAIFAVALLITIAINMLMSWSMGWYMVIPHFIAVSMMLLALQKLKDIESFSTMFLNYDLLASRWVPYAYIYPFAELLAGFLMLAEIISIVSIPLALFIGTVGAVSVFKAVYIDKRELKCACVGGGTKVPLGFVSLTENLMMIGMAVWMLWMVIY